MNLRLFTVVSVVGCAALAGWLVPIDEWVAVAKSVMTVLAILAAAILVRLNRGMPTIDWSKVKAEDRVKLVSEIQKLAREYGVTLLFVGSALVLFLILDRSGASSPLGAFIATKPHAVSVVISAAAGAISAFALIRIGYVVWRDIDIVDLQAGVIAQAANADLLDRRNGIADAIAQSGVVDPRKSVVEDSSAKMD
ncbi:MAG: hypothetical protein WCL10_00005 [Novosphingobium sp.]|uniref:hypothetical protein n=1 Tax=Novosphingobium sp. TaxID=1874826 RepID=UPI0030198B99